MIFELKDRLIEIAKRKGVYKRAFHEAWETVTDNPINLLDESATISKIELRERGAKEKVPFGGRRATTSGTSGAPLIFPQPLSALQREQAFIDRLWQIVGFTAHSRVVVMRGVLVPGGVRQAGNRLIVSCEGWSNEDIVNKFEAIQKFSPEYIHCYPSLLERFLRRCRALDLEFPSSVVAVLSGSEECTLGHEKYFFDMLDCKTLAWYGQSEQVALAVKEANETYAIVPGYSDVAFTHRGDHYEIVGKSRSNPFFAAHWYRTGDLCESIEIAYSTILKCKTLILRGLQGRSDKQVILADGTLIPFNHIVFGLHTQSWLAIDQYCFIQSEPGVLIFAYSLVPTAKSSTLDSLIDLLQARFPEKLKLVTREICKISAMRNAKWRYFFENEQVFNDFTKLA